MDTKLFSLSVVNMALSIILGVVILYFCYYITLKVFEKKGYEIEKNNIAFGIFVGSILLSVGLIVARAFEPAINLTDILKGIYTDSYSLFFQFVKYLFFFVGIALFSALIIIIISMKFYNLLTKDIKELEEISKNNISVALIAGVTIIVISFLALDSISLMIESLIPYPKLQILN